MTESTAGARVQYEQALRNFGNTGRNNAVAVSIGTRNSDEDMLARSARILMGAGEMQMLKQKYRGKGSVPGRKIGE